MTSVWRCLCLYVLCLVGCSHATSIASFASSVRSASTSLESHAVASRLDRMQTSRRLGVHWNRFLLARLLAFVQSPLTYAVLASLALVALAVVAVLGRPSGRSHANPVCVLVCSCPARWWHWGAWASVTRSSWTSWGAPPRPRSVESGHGGSSWTAGLGGLYEPRTRA